ncbi:MAG: GyrI-like domain-containing protein [Planctomycetota bacterium]
MNKDLTRKQLEELYLPPADGFSMIDVPDLPFFMLDGEGSPDDEPFQRAIQWLFVSIHPIRLEAKKRMGRSFVEPPLEGLWWADDMCDLVAGNKDELKWRLMIPAPAWATGDMFAAAVARAEEKRGKAPQSLRLDRYHEGESVQITYVGPYEKEAPKIARRLHEEFLPAHALVPNGPHHEIYLNDTRRTPPEKWRTVVRQPVRPARKTRSPA